MLLLKQNFFSNKNLEVSLRTLFSSIEMERNYARKGAPTKRQGDGNRQERRSYGKAERPERRERSERPEKPARYSAKPAAKYAAKPYAKPYAKRAAKPAAKPVVQEEDGMVRLNKFIANSGVCSRREADTYIAAGVVKVNGKPVTELGTKVNPAVDEISFGGERLRGEKKVYIIMNKPKDYVTSLSDPHAENTVIQLITKTKCPERVYPVGRLDKATTGVLLFTNDGPLADYLTHPSNEIKKIYHVFLDKNLKKVDFDAILEGITLEDGPIAADALEYVEGDKSQIGIQIHSGRNRIVRRIFEHFGYKVKKLDRVYFAGLTKKNIRRGEWRFLTEQEVNLLKMGAVR